MDEVKHLVDPTYIIVDASLGTCAFTTQAINAQTLGAKGVVFVNDIVNYYGKVVQVDDGNGRKVHISVLFINTLTYRLLHSVKNAQIKVQYEVYKTDKANFTYFLAGSGRTNYIFLREFKPYYDKIKDYINFRPIYLTFKCPYCN
jgi:fido (protein-threonine AMPylation protein)